jgi:transposase-like protein
MTEAQAMVFGIDDEAAMREALQSLIRQVEELRQERGVSVDHATINRWVLKYSPQLEAAFRMRCQ